MIERLLYSHSGHWVKQCKSAVSIQQVSGSQVNTEQAMRLCDSAKALFAQRTAANVRHSATLVQEPESAGRIRDSRCALTMVHG